MKPNYRTHLNIYVEHTTEPPTENFSNKSFILASEKHWLLKNSEAKEL